MGRGRAKAKQTKVARELKYHSPNTDFSALQRELGGASSAEDVDEYDQLLDEDDEEDDSEDADDDRSDEDGRPDGGNWAARRR